MAHQNRAAIGRGADSQRKLVLRIETMAAFDGSLQSKRRTKISCSDCRCDGIIPFTKCSHFDRDQSVWMNLFSMQLTADSGNCGDKKLSVTDLGRKSVSDGAKYAGFVWPHRVGDENLN